MTAAADVALAILADAVRAEKCAAVKRMHDERRRRKVCIQNEAHGRAYRGGRCRRCWEKKLEAERRAYARRTGNVAGPRITVAGPTFVAGTITVHLAGRSVTVEVDGNYSQRAVATRIAAALGAMP